ncbi:ATG8-interacting protein 1-like [Magnolia sinica]|uniref:ATG8-interacting protein 1-like n=1 Tax=Magnolia sinica TaxID=86752 RepID=UPI0026590125|nr:ATG8-interacting protein 1-like [Magnolia sinica]
MKGDESDGEETSSRGNDWEVVSLTASTYAAAPGPKGSESFYDYKNEVVTNDEEKSSPAMFMSSHFVYPPQQHENFPVEPDNNEIHNGLGGEGLDQACGLETVQGDRPGKTVEEDWNIKGYSDGHEIHGIPLFNKVNRNLSFHATEFEEVKALQGLNFAEKEQNEYDTAKFSSFHAETDISGATGYDESTSISESNDPSQLNSDSPLAESESQKGEKEDKHNESVLPCEAWWKRQAVSLYNHAKEGNTFWSVVAAAAFLGLVIYGQRRQHESWQIQQLKWQCSINDEKINQMLGSISWCKDVLVGSNRNGPVIRVSITAATAAAAAEH